MITRELKMSVLHFNPKRQMLEVVSTYSIDRQILGGAHGKQLKEIAYMTYDQELRTMVIVFREDFILTVNIDERKQSGDCNCVSHPEIKNFTLTEIESSTALSLK
jgi:hypothetical protein